jgi:hypothetical protein
MVLAATASPALAQPAAPDSVSVSASLTGIGQLDAKLDQGGNFRWNGLIVQGGATWQFTPEFSAAISLRYGIEGWHFGHAVGARRRRAVEPRQPAGSRIQDCATGQPAAQSLHRSELEWSYESGASASDAKNFRARSSAPSSYFRRRSCSASAGGVFPPDRQDPCSFPLLIVNWQIDDDWRVGNPFQAGPAGGAGLELVRALGAQWELAAGASFRDYRFRLRSDGPAPDGVRPATRASRCSRG